MLNIKYVVLDMFYLWFTALNPPSTHILTPNPNKLIPNSDL